MEELKTWYYGVVYFTNGEASVSGAFESEQRCIEETAKGVKTHPHLIAGTTYITRKSVKPLPVTKLFGTPKSRDLMRNKAFLKELTNDGRKG